MGAIELTYTEQTILSLAIEIYQVSCFIGERSRRVGNFLRRKDHFIQNNEIPKRHVVYDVFVSYCGEDTRPGFTDHLFAALERKGILAYRDDLDIPRGTVIEMKLLEALEPSRVAVIVFPKNYAASKWCLYELLKIMACKRKLNDEKVVLPVFYDVSPSEVRKHKGNFAIKIEDGNEDRLERWKAALTKAANLAVLDLKPNCSETDFIDECVEHIWQTLNEESATAAISPHQQIDVVGENTSELTPKEATTINHKWTLGFKPHPFYFPFACITGLCVVLLIKN